MLWSWGLRQGGDYTTSLEPAFLAEIGWDLSVRVIAPPPGHRLLQDAGVGLGYARGGNLRGCAVRGCERRVTAPGREQARAGLGVVPARARGRPPAMAPG